MEMGALVTGLAFTGFLSFWRGVGRSRVQTVGDGVSDLILAVHTKHQSLNLGVKQCPSTSAVSAGNES